MRERWEILTELTQKCDARTVVEVGVSRGICSSNWLRLCPYIVTAYLVDRDSSVWDIGLYQDYGIIHRIKYVKADSIEASKLVPDDLNLVYIDAGHGAEEVEADIRAWMPKIRKGGIICGHDYTLIDSKHTKVRDAVDKLFTKEQIHLEADVLEKGSLYIWWVQL